MVIAHLDDHAWILGEECLHYIAVPTDVMQVDMQAAFPIGKTHLQKRGDQTARRNVVACHHPAPLHQLLHRIEGIGKILRILHRGHIVAHLA